MKIIRPGLADNEILYECVHCHCQFIFEVNEMIGIQVQGGYIKCPHCNEMHFVSTNKHLTIKITKEKS